MSAHCWLWCSQRCCSIVACACHGLTSLTCRVDKDVQPKGTANFTRAFDKAFSILDASFAVSPSLRQRPTVVLFLTDNEADSPAETILQHMNKTFADDAEQLLIFAFGVGNGVTDKAAKTLR